MRRTPSADTPSAGPPPAGALPAPTTAGGGAPGTHGSCSCPAMAHSAACPSRSARESLLTLKLQLGLLTPGAWPNRELRTKKFNKSQGYLGTHLGSCGAAQPRAKGKRGQPSPQTVTDRRHRKAPPPRAVLCCHLVAACGTTSARADGSFR